MGRGRPPRAEGGADRYDARDDFGRDNQPYGDEGYDDTGYASRENAALIPANESANLPALADESAQVPVIIRGSGVSMGTPFIKRRERPLSLRIAVVTLMVCILVTGLFAVTPLGTSADGGGGDSSFQALAGAVVWHSEPSFHWYTAAFGDTVEGIAAKFHVEVGGIYQMNGLLAGQEITVGKEYKIPDDPYYGKDFRPASYIVNTGNGATVYGDSPWTSLAGTPPRDATCGPNGNGDPAGYKLGGTDKGAGWVRGFTWFHNGVDLSAPEGHPITAAQAGEVIWAGWDVGGLGWSIKINHCNNVSTVYGHMDKLLVSVHQLVDIGDQIGLEGSTGWSTGPHLHYMVEWQNNPVDPLEYYGWNIYNICH